MTVKVTKSLTLKTLIPDIEKNFRSDRSAQRRLISTIKETIQSGKSPVRGKTFKQYNSDYADRFKGGRRRPVDMTITGEMLRSLILEPTKGSWRVVFTSGIADFHNRQGAGVNRIIRRLLPTNRGERFKAFLEKQIENAANESVARAVNKQNR